MNIDISKRKRSPITSDVTSNNGRSGFVEPTLLSTIGIFLLCETSA